VRDKFFLDGVRVADYAPIATSGKIFGGRLATKAGGNSRFQVDLSKKQDPILDKNVSHAYLKNIRILNTGFTTY
jgi:hypothetical protein